MVKVILEKEDILALILAKYPNADIDEEPLEDIEVVVRVKELKAMPQQPEQKIVRDENGNIDADKSGLALKNREKTVPGGAMGRNRGNMPVF